MQIIPIHVGDLPESVIPLEMVSVVKFLDEDGKQALAVRISEGLTHWEVIGMLVAAGDAARAELVSEFRDKREGTD